jgi:hypothetical protein
VGQTLLARTPRVGPPPSVHRAVDRCAWKASSLSAGDRALGDAVRGLS